MREEIEAIINEQLDKAEPLLEDFYDSENTKNIINIKADKQNQISKENIRKKLLEKVSVLAKSNEKITYNENSSIEELEKIINTYNGKEDV